MRPPKPRVLVFEDDLQILTVYALAMAQTARLSLYTRIEPALEVVQAADLLITDCDLPGSGGCMLLLRHLRELALAVPVLVVTGDPERADLHREFPGQPVLGKPFTLEQLDAALARLGFPGLVRLTK